MGLINNKATRFDGLDSETSSKIDRSWIYRKWKAKRMPLNQVSLGDSFNIPAMAMADTSQEGRQLWNRRLTVDRTVLCLLIVSWVSKSCEEHAEVFQASSFDVFKW